MSLRFQRLSIILVSLIMVLGAVLLILYNVRENVSYFYTPSELISSKIEFDKKVRIGGFIKENTFSKISASSFNFQITDKKNSIDVVYEGTLPDLFREGQGAVIEGYMNEKRIFNAENVFAKHDENYMPASIKEDLEDEGYWNKKYK